MGYEPNELLALAFVTIAGIATVLVRAHHSNTPRTREWWGRFLVLVGLLLVAQIATNVEQGFPPESGPGRWLNILEHVSLVVAGAWALTLAIRGLAETYARHGLEGGGEA